jgi:Ribosomally synthesized peptide prototyped by Frankia Franean1_4349.
MATQAQIERLIGRALVNPEFRTLLLQDPQAAAGKLRYKLDDSQVERIRGVDPETADALAADLARALTSPHGGPIGFW